MVQDQSTAIERDLQQITDKLLINGTLIKCPGLIYGKMGIAVFFFQYARYTGNELFEDYAVEIIQAIQTEIHKDSLTDYDRGLTGIGAGIEYLSQNRFLAIDTDEILEDFDSRIRHDIMYIQQENNRLANGLCGLGQYLLYRINSCSADMNELCLLINQESMMHVVNILENDTNVFPKDLPDIISFLCRLYKLDICNPKIDRYMDKVLKDLSFNDIPNEQLFSWSLALLRIVSIRTQITDTADKVIDRTLQLMESKGESLSDSWIVDLINQLLWLLQCKRLIKQTSANMDWSIRIDALLKKIFPQKEDKLYFEKGKLSLKGSAGVGLAMMTLSGKCDDAWLDLLG